MKKFATRKLKPPRRLPSHLREGMFEAAERVLDCHSRAIERGLTILDEILPKSRKLLAWDHYPRGDREDHKSGVVYFYHCHALDDGRGPEHGHFHIFLRPKALPDGAKPVRQSRRQGQRAKDHPLSELAHLASISIDRLGWPMAIFTVNRWVTDETVYDAATMIATLDAITRLPQRKTLDRWMAGMVTLFRPDFEALLRARDEGFSKYRARFPRRDVFQDHDFEVPSLMPISIIDRLKLLEGDAAAT